MTLYRFQVAGADPLDEWVTDDPEDIVDPQVSVFVGPDYARNFLSPEELHGSRLVSRDTHETLDIIGAEPKGYYRIEYLYPWSEPEGQYWSGWKYQTLSQARDRRKRAVPAGNAWMAYLQRWSPGTQPIQYVAGEP
jgi:hypothetical protein